MILSIYKYIKIFLYAKVIDINIDICEFTYGVLEYIDIIL